MFLIGKDLHTISDANSGPRFVPRAQTIAVVVKNKLVTSPTIGDYEEA